MELDAQLKAAKIEYDKSAEEERSRIEQYEQNRRGIQLHRHLDSFRIGRAHIKGIGPAKEASLASYGIETAADIVKSKVLQVPGFGPSNSQLLLDWRKEKERKFVYSPQLNSHDAQEIARIRNDIASKRSLARKILLSGAGNKERLVERIILNSKIPDKSLEKLNMGRVQARTDLKYLNIQEPKILPRQSAPLSVAMKPIQSNITIAQPSPPITLSTPTCPRCRSVMMKRRARRGGNSGNYFWGCSRFPSCRGTRAF